jgi:hypothetical protein
VRSRLLTPGAACLLVLLLAGCVAVAWPGGSPLVPRNGGHPAGDAGWAWAFLGLLVAAFAVYALATLAAARGRVPLRAALAVAVVIQVLPLAAPLLLSTDAWTYWDYGRLAAANGANPYADVPAAFPLDPAFPHMGTRWHETTSVYGPAFTLASEPLGLAAGASADAAAWLYKSLAAAGMVVAALLAARLSRRPALAAVAVGWSPLLAVHGAGAGHNDAWLAALLLGALAAAASRRPVLAGAGWAAAALLKWVPLLLLPLRLLAARRTPGALVPGSPGPAGTRPLLAGAAGFVATAAVLVALACWRYGTEWLDALVPLARNTDDPTGFSLTGRLEQLGVGHGVAVALPAALLAAAAVPLLVAAWRGRARIGLAAVLLVGLSPLLAPWYLLWAVPLAAADDDDLALGLGVVLSAYVLVQTVPV